MAMTVTLYQGDCLDVMREMPTGSVDAVVTDPPYITVVNSNVYGKTNPWADMVNAAVWFGAWMAECRRILRPTGALWACMSWKSLPIYMKAALDMRWKMESALVWDKEWIGPGGHVGLRPSYEMVGLFPGEAFAIADRGLPDIQRFKWSSFKPNGHPAEKPEALMRWLIEISGNAGDTILDPFMGSGTTGAACIASGRHFVGIEHDATWYAIAERRIADAQMQPSLDGML